MSIRFLDTDPILRYLTRDDERQALLVRALLARVEGGDESALPRPWSTSTWRFIDSWVVRSNPSCSFGTASFEVTENVVLTVRSVIAPADKAHPGVLLSYRDYLLSLRFRVQDKHQMNNVGRR